MRASVAFVQHCDFGCAELSEKKWLHVFVANVWKWMTDSVWKRGGTCDMM